MTLNISSATEMLGYENILLILSRQLDGDRNCNNTTVGFGVFFGGPTFLIEINFS